PEDQLAEELPRLGDPPGVREDLREAELRVHHIDAVRREVRVIARQSLEEGAGPAEDRLGLAVPTELDQCARQVQVRVPRPVEAVLAGDGAVRQKVLYGERLAKGGPRPGGPTAPPHDAAQPLQDPQP